MTDVIRRGIPEMLLPLALVFAGCSQQAPEKTSTDIGSPEETGVLQVATRNGSTTYYLDRHENPIGPEFSLISKFAKSKGWTVEWTMHDSTAQVLKAPESGGTYLAAAGLTHLPSRTERFTRGLASQHEGITFTKDDALTTEILLAEVAEKDLDCTVADSNIVQVMRRHFPHLEVAMNLSDGKNLVWYAPVAFECSGQ